MKKWTDFVKNMHDNLFFCSYGILLIAGTLHRTFFAIYYDYYYTYIYILCWSVLAVSEIGLLILGEYKCKDWLLGVICGCLFLILFRIIRDSLEFATLIPLMFTARNVSFDKIAKITVILQGMILACVGIMGMTGFITNIWSLTYSEIGEFSYTTRNLCFMGTLYHLYPGNIMLNINMMAMYLMRNRLKKSILFSLVGANIVIYILSAGRTAYLVSIAVIVWGWMYSLKEKNKKKNINKVAGMALFAVFPIALMASFFLIYIFDSNIAWMNKVDVLIGNRLSYAHQVVDKYGIKMGGQHVELVGGGLLLDGTQNDAMYLWADNAWVNMLVRYGVVVTIVICILYSFLMMWLWKNKDFYVIGLLCILIVQMFMDDCNIYFYFNTVLLMLGKAFSQEKNEDEIVGKMVETATQI